MHNRDGTPTCTVAMRSRDPVSNPVSCIIIYGEGLVIFADDHEKAFPRDFGRISCDIRLDIRDFGKKCEIKGNKEKSRESGGSGQGKQPWGVGRYGMQSADRPRRIT